MENGSKDFLDFSQKVRQLYTFSLSTYYCLFSGGPFMFACLLLLSIIQRYTLQYCPYIKGHHLVEQ